MAVDVAIVGAGPAGAWCAHELASAGAQVAIFDPSHPREKPCGGGVTQRALALVGLDRGAARGATIEAGTFACAGRSASLSLTGPHGPRLEVFSRRDFDAHVLARATAAGAIHIAERVKDVVLASGLSEVTTANRRIRAAWVVGADGANSLVRRRVSQPFARGDLSIACGYYVPAPASNRIDIEFVSQPAGYIWSFPRPDHLAIGIGAQADESSTATLMPLVDTWIKDNVPPGSERRERYSWPIPSLTAASLDREIPAGPGWMLVGDAAGLVDPITREGIFFALQSGGFAAQSLLREDGDPGQAYADRVRAEIYPELHRAARLKTHFFRPAFIHLLVRALQRSPRIAEVMADLVAGEQPYHSLKARLIRTCEMKLMWELLSLQRT